MKFIDFFAGINRFRKGFKMAGHKPIGFCENIKYAIKAYKAMYKMKAKTTAKSEVANGI